MIISSYMNKIKDIIFLMLFIYEDIRQLLECIPSLFCMHVIAHIIQKSSFE